MNFTKTVMALSVLALGSFVNPQQALAQENKREVTKKDSNTDHEKVLVNAATILNAHMEGDGVDENSSAQKFLNGSRLQARYLSERGHDKLADMYIDANREIRKMIEDGAETVGDLKEELESRLENVYVPKGKAFSNKM